MQVFTRAHISVHTVIRDFPAGSEIIFCCLPVPALHKHLTSTFKSTCAWNCWPRRRRITVPEKSFICFNYSIVDWRIQNRPRNIRCKHATIRVCCCTSSLKCAGLFNAAWAAPTWFLALYLFHPRLTLFGSGLVLIVFHRRLKVLKVVYADPLLVCTIVLGRSNFFLLIVNYLCDLLLQNFILALLRCRPLRVRVECGRFGCCFLLS